MMRPTRQAQGLAPALLALAALAGASALGCKKEPDPGLAAMAGSASSAPASPSYVVTPVTVASSAAPPPLAPFVAPPPPPPAKPIVAKEGEALVTKADCAAWAGQYSKIMSGYFDEPTHAACGPKAELVEARREMLPMFAEHEADRFDDV